MIVHNFPASCPSPPECPLEVLGRFADVGVVGGAVYDGLVGIAADNAGRILLTRDERAERTYRRLKVEYEPVARTA